MRPLLAVLGLAVLMTLGSQALADGAHDKAEPAFDAVGELSTGKVAVGGETTGISLKTDRGTFELSLTGELAPKARQLHGKKVHVIGALKVVSGTEVKDRQIVVVESLAAVE